MLTYSPIRLLECFVAVVIAVCLSIVIYIIVRTPE